MHPRLYLVCGLPGSGKTTRSRQIVAFARAVHLCPDDWVARLGVSLVDYEFRFKLQDCMLLHAASLLRSGIDVVVEFGSWSRNERETIRQTAVAEGATTELHYLNAPVAELERRVRARGGPEAEALVNVLHDAAKFEQPTAAETASFDRYLGPNDEWTAALPR